MLFVRDSILVVALPPKDDGVGEAFQPLLPYGGWVCESLDTACVERITMNLPDYEKLRSDGNQFAVKPGHEVSRRCCGCSLPWL